MAAIVLAFVVPLLLGSDVVIVSPLGAATSASNLHGPPTLVTMGETMLRFSPLDSGNLTDTTRHHPHPFMRSIGGDELNVAVAIRMIGYPARWISILPTGPLGDVITASCSHYGLEFAGLRVPNADIGSFYVLPEARTVHYQRRHSAFALHEPDSLDWTPLLSARRPWLHMTGITPLVSDAAYRSWDRALARAAEASIPTSLDLNHRKQLGTLDTLWSMVRPHASRLELLILSVEQVRHARGAYAWDHVACGRGHVARGTYGASTRNAPLKPHLSLSLCTSSPLAPQIISLCSLAQRPRSHRAGSQEGAAAARTGRARRGLLRAHGDATATLALRAYRPVPQDARRAGLATPLVRAYAPAKKGYPCQKGVGRRTRGALLDV